MITWEYVEKKYIKYIYHMLSIEDKGGYILYSWETEVEKTRFFLLDITSLTSTTLEGDSSILVEEETLA